MNRRLGGPHSWSGRFGEQKNLMPLLGIECQISQHVALSLYGPCHPSCMCEVIEHTNLVTNRIMIDWKQAMQSKGHSFSPLFYKRLVATTV
jgi:hypothetical protein